MKTETVNDNAQSDESAKQDIYTRITAKIVAALEDGVRPWVSPWNAERPAGRITRPLRHNGQPYTGINVLSLWVSAGVQGFAAPIWMTDREPREDHGFYIASWLKVLKSDNRAIFAAVSHAQRAADFSNGLQPAFAA